MSVIAEPGVRFGRLVVAEQIGVSTRGAVWRCKCDCGGEKDVVATRLNRGHVTSCGCKRWKPDSSLVVDRAPLSFTWGDPRLPSRFWDKVIPEPNSGCWLWIGYLDRRGYGTFKVNGAGMQYAHRVSYLALRGPITNELDHKCRTPTCCNPWHLDDVTHWINMLRATSPSTQCDKGHEYAEHGFVDSSGYRRCRLCTRAKQQAWKDKQREVTP